MADFTDSLSGGKNTSMTFLTHHVMGRTLVWQTLLTHYVAGRNLVCQTLLTHHMVGGTSEWQDRKSSDLMMPHFLADHCFRCGYWEHVSCNQNITAFKMIHNALWPLNHVQEQIRIFYLERVNCTSRLLRHKTYSAVQKELENGSISTLKKRYTS